MAKHKSIPTFENEDQERAFWAEQDSAEYVDWSKAEKIILPNLKPTSKTISLRIPGFIFDELKLIANKRDIPYQSLIKIFLKEKIDQEFSRLP
jgi:predicted DNA binding CopG/RHH family protein